MAYFLLQKRKNNERKKLITSKRKQLLIGLVLIAKLVCNNIHTFNDFRKIKEID